MSARPAVGLIRPSSRLIVVVLPADRMAGTGASLAPLHGVPFTIKECFDLVGTWTPQQR